jgi:hypothetical protein
MGELATGGDGGGVLGGPRGGDCLFTRLTHEGWSMITTTSPRGGRHGGGPRGGHGVGPWGGRGGGVMGGARRGASW